MLRLMLYELREGDIVFAVIDCAHTRHMNSRGDINWQLLLVSHRGLILNVNAALCPEAFLLGTVCRVGYSRQVGFLDYLI